MAAMSDIPHPLRAYRETVGLTCTAFAKKLGVTPAALSRWEARKRNPSFNRIRQIQELTGGAVSANDFMPAEPQARAS